jgi:hypothetical protein
MVSTATPKHSKPREFVRSMVNACIIPVVRSFTVVPSEQALTNHPTRCARRRCRDTRHIRWKIVTTDYITGRAKDATDCSRSAHRFVRYRVYHPVGPEEEDHPIDGSYDSASSHSLSFSSLFAQSRATTTPRRAATIPRYRRCFDSHSC